MQLPSMHLGTLIAFLLLFSSVLKVFECSRLVFSLALFIPPLAPFLSLIRFSIFSLPSGPCVTATSHLFSCVLFHVAALDAPWSCYSTLLGLSPARGSFVGWDGLDKMGCCLLWELLCIRQGSSGQLWQLVAGKRCGLPVLFGLWWEIVFLQTTFCAGGCHAVVTPALSPWCWFVGVAGAANQPCSPGSFATTHTQGCCIMSCSCAMWPLQSHVCWAGDTQLLSVGFLY